MSADNSPLNYKVVAQPPNVIVPLYNHQRHLIHMMEQMERQKARFFTGRSIKTDLGILGEAMGYGKTLTVIGLVDRDRMAWDEKPYLEENYSAINKGGNFCVVRRTLFPKVNCNLVVASLSVISHWARELKEKAPALSFIILDSKGKIDVTNLSQYQFVLCSVTMTRYLASMYRSYAFKRLIYDEADSSNVAGLDKVHAGFTWLITGTYRELDHIKSRSYMKQITSILGEATLDDLVVKCDPEILKSSKSIPPFNEVEYKFNEALMVNVVNEFLDAPIRERLSVGDIEGAIEALDTKSESKCIVNHVIAKFTKALKHSVENRNKYREEENPELEEKWEQSIISIRATLSRIKEKFDRALYAECTICKEQLQTPYLTPCCQNVSCYDCISTWVREHSTCPFCREALLEPALVQLVRMGDPLPAAHASSNGVAPMDATPLPQRAGPAGAAVEFPSVEKPSKTDRAPEEKPLTSFGTKNDALVDILKKPGSFAIFCSSDAGLDIVKRYVIDSGKAFFEIKGRSGIREQMIDEFNAGRLPILLLNGKATGAGINLQGGTDCIIYGNMSEEIEQQCICRLWRMGQTKVVNVHRLR